MTRHGGQPVTGSGMVTGAFLCVSLFPEVHFFAVLNPNRVQGSSDPSDARGKERGSKREKDRERATKSRDAWEGPDPASQGAVASTCEIVA